MNINLEVTPEQAKFLLQFAKNQHEGARDNVGTRKPLHLVQTMREVVVFDGGDSGVRTAYWSSDVCECFDTPEELVKGVTGKMPLTYENAYLYGIEGEEIFDEEDYFKAFDLDGFQKVSIVENWDTVAYFFILAEAKRYIAYQSHNLNHPRTYTVDMGYGNKGDYEPFWDLLMEIGGQILKGDGEREKAEG